MNATIRKFGHPGTLVADYRHWVVLLRPAQPTLGSLVLAAKSDVTAFGALPSEAFAELATVTSHIEVALAETVEPEKINYLMLMMVDRHVHFHVIPRYEGSRTHSGLTATDIGWPRLPALGEAVELDADSMPALLTWLKAAWPA